MLSDEVIEKVNERLVRRIEQGNTYILQQIAKSVKKIGTLSPSKAQELVQILRYGGDYDKIVKKLAEITELNVKDIKKIFEEVAKSNYLFAEKFYDYRNKKYIPWDENIALREQVNALADITANEYRNLSNTLAFATHDRKGKVIYNSIARTYQDKLDEAILSVGQGKETFDNAVYRIIKDLATSGIRTVDYESGRSMRLDSAVRMQMQGAIRDLNIKMQEIIGEEFGADGVEISVHIHPAPDHALVQGRQFSKEEFEKFQNDQDCVSYDGMKFPAVASETGRDRRSIGQYNCYHYTFAIVLGLDNPRYSNEELQKIIDENEKGFKIGKKKYTLYEGEQIQRKLELEIRKYKDLQIEAKTTKNEKALFESQYKINELTKQYKELSEKSGLSYKSERMRIPGYRKVKIPASNNNISNKKKNTFDFEEYRTMLAQKDIIVDDSIKELDSELVERNLIHLDYLSDKYNITDRQYLVLEKANKTNGTIGTTYYSDNRITLNANYFNNKEKIIDAETKAQNLKWHNKINKDNLDLYTMTHEYGHAVENNYVRKYVKAHHQIDTDVRRAYYKNKEDIIRKEIDKDIRDSLFKEIRKSENLSITEIKDKYFSNYGKSKVHYEWFAETFAQMILGEENALTKALKEWLERNY